MWYLHTMEYYSALKRKTFLIQAVTWKRREDNMLSIISQSQKHKGCVILLVWGSKSNQIQREKDGGCQGIREGNIELLFNGCEVSDGEDERVPEADGEDSCSTMWMLSVCCLFCLLQNQNQLSLLLHLRMAKKVNYSWCIFYNAIVNIFLKRLKKK